MNATADLEHEVIYSARDITERRRDERGSLQELQDALAEPKDLRKICRFAHTARTSSRYELRQTVEDYLPADQRQVELRICLACYEASSSPSFVNHDE